MQPGYFGYNFENFLNEILRITNMIFTKYTKRSR